MFKYVGLNSKRRRKTLQTIQEIFSLLTTYLTKQNEEL